jgi:hypothetical protein
MDTNKAQELKEQIQSLQSELALTLEAMEADKGRWRADKHGVYWALNDETGRAIQRNDHSGDISHYQHKSGNYYQTEEQAKLGPEYFHANSEYMYWHQDMPKPYSQPEGCQYYRLRDNSWVRSNDETDIWERSPRRWPKTSTVEWVKP